MAKDITGMQDIRKRPGRPRKKKPTDKAKELVKVIAEEGCSLTEAQRKVGYSPNTYALNNKFVKSELEKLNEQMVQAMQEYAPKALSNMVDLAENANSENVRFSATKDLLDRAGYKPVDKKEITGQFVDANSRITNDILNRYQTIIDAEVIDIIEDDEA